LGTGFAPNLRRHSGRPDDDLSVSTSIHLPAKGNAYFHCTPVVFGVFTGCWPWRLQAPTGGGWALTSSARLRSTT
jgi:hypothetical protein